MSADDDEFIAWMTHGAAKGWVTLPVCVSHSPLPLTPEEEDTFELVFQPDGEDAVDMWMDDPCFFAMRVWKEFDYDSSE